MCEAKQPLLILTGPTAAWKDRRFPSPLQRQWMERSFQRIPCRYTGEWTLAEPKSEKKKCREFDIILLTSVIHVMNSTW